MSSEYWDEEGVDYSEVSPPRATLKRLHGEWTGGGTFSGEA